MTTAERIQSWGPADRIVQIPKNLVPRPCCAEFGAVTACDETFDEVTCPVCDAVWMQPCQPRMPR